MSSSPLRSVPAAAAPHSRATRTLHWVVAVLVLALLCVGFYMAASGDRSPMPLHKSVGMLALVFIAVRLVWRLTEGWPAPAAAYPAWERTLSRVAQWVLLLATLCMPLSGMLISAAGGRGLYFFGVPLLASHPDAANPGKFIPLDRGLAELGAQIHGVLAWVIAIAVLLHIAGALKHHLIDRDATLRRMLGRS